MNTKQITPSLLITLFFVVFGLQANAQFWKKKAISYKNQPQTTEVRAIQDFSKVSVQQGIRVQYSIGSPYLSVTAADNIISEIETIVVNNELIIRYKKGTKPYLHAKPEITIRSNQLSAVKASSSSRFIAENSMKTKQFSAKASSSAQIQVSIKTDKLTAKASSSGRLTITGLYANNVDASSSSSGVISLSGESRKSTLSASSSGSIIGKEFHTEECTAKASSSGSITVDVDKKLSGTASSSGRIRYKGNPTSIHKKTSSSGSVRKLLGK